MTDVSARAAVWDELRRSDIVVGEPPDAGRADSPWYVRAMLGIAGWIAAIFAFAFIAAAFAVVLRSPSAAIVTGMAIIGATYVLFRAAGNNDFAAQFGMAASFAGQAFVVFGVFSENGNATVEWTTLAVLEAALVWLVPNFVHRVWSAFAAGTIAAIILATLGGYFLGAGLLALAAAIVWLDEFDWARHHSLVQPLGYGLTLALVLVQGSIFGHGELRSIIHGMSVDVMPAWVGPALSAVVLILVTARLVVRVAGSATAARGLPLVAATIIAAVSFRAPGIATGFMIVLIGFANGSRTLLGLGVAALIGYLSAYYYLLETTLLVKSLTLALTGGVLLAMRIALAAALPRDNAEAQHA